LASHPHRSRTISTLAALKRHFGDELPALIAAQLGDSRKMAHRDARWRDRRPPECSAKAATSVDPTPAAVPRNVMPTVDNRLIILFGPLLSAVSMWQMTQFSLCPETAQPLRKV
jgi:hypothetical protein